MCLTVLENFCFLLIHIAGFAGIINSHKTSAYKICFCMLLKL